MWKILVKLIVPNGLIKLPKVQKIAQSGHTDYMLDKKTFVLF